MGSKASKLLEDAQKSGTREINLKETNLKHIPLIVCTNFNYITKLNLNDNLIKDIPPDIYKLRALKTLWLNKNKLSMVVDEVGLLSELEELQIDNNVVSKIGKVFFELKKIRDLSMSGNQFKELPSDIMSLSSLKTLTLEYNQLTALPGSLGSLSNLKTLNAGYNSIEYIYGDVVNMSSLTNLTLCSNRLPSLPDGIGRMTSLMNLNLRSNNLVQLPHSFSHLTALTTLSLWDNSFSLFPESLCEVVSLTELSFNNNRLESIPPQIKNLVNLRKLYLQYNQIESIPVEIKYLKNLNHLLLQHNKLTAIPCEISTLKSLESINLTGNPINPRLLQLDHHALMKHMHAEFLNKRDICARMLQRHFRAWKKQYRFRNVVMAVMEQHQQEKSVKMVNDSILLIKAATKIQRWWRSRKRRMQWYDLVSKIILINSTIHQLQQQVNLHQESHHNGENNQQQSSPSKSIPLPTPSPPSSSPPINNNGSISTHVLETTFENEHQQQHHQNNQINVNRSTGIGSLFGFDEPDSEENIIYYTPEVSTLLDSQVTGVVPSTPIIKCATVPKLVEHLCYTTYNEPGFTRAFFATYTSFLEPTELFQLLCVRYHVEPPIDCTAEQLAHFRKTIKPRIQERVIELMSYWIKNHLNDFEVNAKLLKNFNSFLTNTLLSEKETSAKRLIAIFNETKKKNRDDLEELIKLASSAPKPILPLKPMDGTEISLLDLSTIEVARQMALIDQTMLGRISAKELLSKKWSSANINNMDICPNIINMIQVFNNGSQWVASEIVSEKSSKQRLKRLKFFLDVARHCFEMSNFNGLMMIVSGLSSSSVGRLKGTWGALSSRRREQFDEMERFVNMEGNFKLYRLLLAEVKGPCIPFVGLYLMDLTFMDEGNPTYLNDNLLNFVKKRLEANSINKFLSYRNTPYFFEPVLFIQDLLLNSNALSEKELYERSIAIEKRHLRKISKKQSRERMLTSAELSLDSSNEYPTPQSNINNGFATTSTAGGSKKQPPQPPLSPGKQIHRLKKGDIATTSSPAIITSPNKPPTLDFSVTSPSKLNIVNSPNSLYHSVDNSPMNSPRFNSQQHHHMNQLHLNNNNNSIQSPNTTYSTIRSTTSSYISPPSSPRNNLDSPFKPPSSRLY